jgi:hypothetical protein
VSNTYCVFFCLCLVYTMMLVSLYCLFLIGPSVFSNVYYWSFGILLRLFLVLQYSLPFIGIQYF